MPIDFFCRSSGASGVRPLRSAGASLAVLVALLQVPGAFAQVRPAYPLDGMEARDKAAATAAGAAANDPYATSNPFGTNTRDPGYVGGLRDGFPANGADGRALSPERMPDEAPLRGQRSVERPSQNSEEREESPGRGPAEAGKLRPPRLNEFQKYVKQVTGKSLPRFGMEFFERAAPTPANREASVPNDYLIGPGDELTIHVWGQVSLDVRGVVSREGQLFLPRVGPVSLAGVRMGEAEAVLRKAVGRMYRGFDLSVSLGKLRGISVFVVGQVRKPGSYSVSSLSTVLHVLLEAGGPNDGGSLRRIAVKRGGKTVADLDLYGLIGKGDNSGDLRLADGDVVFVPPAVGYVALLGQIEMPAVFELARENEPLQDLLTLVGGVSPLADPRRAFIEHLSPGEAQPRSMEEFSLLGEGLQRRLQRGDIVSILPIKPEFANAVTLRGAVAQPLRMPFRAGMRVHNLIPDRATLLSRLSVRRQNEALLDQDRRDQLKVQNEEDRRDPAKAAREARETKDSREPVRRELPSLADSVGGALESVNLDYAVVERLNRRKLKMEIYPIDLARAIDDPASQDNLALEAGDTLTVFSADDLPVPTDSRTVFVRVEGEVLHPGVYDARPGEKLVDVIQRAGGLTSRAYLFGTEFTRVAVRENQQKNLDRFLKEFEERNRAAQATALAGIGSGEGSATLQARVTQQAEFNTRILDRLKDAKPTGRVTLGMQPDERSLAALPEFVPENGDRVFIPAKPLSIQVAGAVSTDSAQIWRPQSTVQEYLRNAGLRSNADLAATFLLRADGSVRSEDGGWFNDIHMATVLPGDVIVVPEKFELETSWAAFLRSSKDVTSIFYNLGLGAAAIKTLRN